MDAAVSYISDEMRALIGKPFGRMVSFPISVSDIRRWAIATYYPEPAPPLFWDEQVARRSRFGGIVTPEEFNPFAWATAVPAPGGVTAGPAPSGGRANHNLDFLENAHGVPGPCLPVNLNAGLTARYGVRMRPGDVITAESSILSYEQKSGRMGQMLVSVNRTIWHNQFGDLVKQSDQTSIRY